MRFPDFIIDTFKEYRDKSPSSSKSSNTTIKLGFAEKLTS
jgi:hypothetical protein